MEIPLLTALIITIMSSQFKIAESCLTRAGEQIFLDNLVEEDVTQIYNGVKIYAKTCTPDKCDSGERSIGDFPAAYMRKPRYNQIYL